MSDAPKETIIIAEDSTPNRKILGHLLEKLGYTVVACENGELAWQALNSGEHANVVAVISDIMMPSKDGIQLLKDTRESVKFKNIPFVLVTALTDKDSIVRAKDLGVNGYILKPVTFQRVTAKLQELFPARTFPKIAG